MSMISIYKAGYTLIELSFTVALLGVLAGSALAIANERTETRNIRETTEELESIEEAIHLFFNQNERLPCPASLTITENHATLSASFGVEDDCTAASPALAGISEVHTTADEVWIGALPVRTLGLPNHRMYDKWKQRYRYAVVKTFADGTGISGKVGANVADMIRIDDANGNQVNPAVVDNPVVYVITSHGKDKRGGYTQSGVIASPCNTTKDEENCDADTIFIDQDIADSTVNARYYHDFILWKTKHNLGYGGINF